MDKYSTKLHYHSDAWMNDPKLFFWEGEYHIFYQYKWPRHWAHIKSTDLIHWEELPVALTPDAEGPEAVGGCFTGCCIRAYDKFHLFYTGCGEGEKQTTCHAVSDDLINWSKDPNNPIIEAQPPYALDGAWRDPCVWQDNGKWYMAQCAEMAGTTGMTSGCIALMSSDDLMNWKMEDPLYYPGGMGMCECPDIFELNGKYIGLFSCFKTFCVMSDEIRGKYKLAPTGTPVNGDVFYAGKTLKDDKGRRLMWGFLFENCGFEDYFERWKLFLEDREWRNVLSFPSVLSLNEKGGLSLSLPEEFLSLRKKEYSLLPGKTFGSFKILNGSMFIGSGEDDFSRLMFDGIKSDCFEITAKLVLNNARKAGFLIRCDEEFKSNVTAVSVCKPTNSILIEDCRMGLLSPHTRLWDAFSKPPSFAVSAPIHGGVDGEVELRIIVDVSVVEVYINNESCLTGRCYPDKSDLSVGLFSVSGEAEIKDLRIWELAVD